MQGGRWHWRMGRLVAEMNLAMTTTSSDALLSGRAQDRLSQLHRVLAVELRTLTTQHSLLLGALQACDAATQNVHLQEYLMRLDGVLAAVNSLRAFVVRQTELHTA